VSNSRLPGSAERLLAGFAVGLSFPIFAFIVWQPQLWSAILVVGVIAAAIPLLLTIMIYLWLRGLGQLRVWWAALVGALGTASPVILLDVLGAASADTSTGMENAMWEAGGPFTIAGLEYFVLPSLPFFGLGLLAGLAGWLVAYGWRLAPPNQSRPRETAVESHT